ncbi:alpha/beta hydrolase [Kitasatospora sp. NPDC004531]
MTDAIAVGRRPAPAASPSDLFRRGAAEGRRAAAVVDERWLVVPGGPTGAVKVRVVRPAGVRGPLPVVLYLHGGGRVFGDAHTRCRLLRELAVGARAAVLFPEFDRSPEARQPVAVAAEQGWTVARWAVTEGRAMALDPGRIAVAGDSTGGNLAAALALMAKKRGGVRLRRQVLLCPVTDPAHDTPSYRGFATGYFLRRDAARWFWDQYTSDLARRAGATASPLRASIDQLTGLPPALIVTAQADVLRAEGEAYAAKLRAAGVPVTAVRLPGSIHDLATPSAPAARDAVALAGRALREALHERRAG